jgi:hypothetical protein
LRSAVFAFGKGILVDAYKYAPMLLHQCEPIPDIRRFDLPDGSGRRVMDRTIRFSGHNHGIPGQPEQLPEFQCNRQIDVFLHDAGFAYGTTVNTTMPSDIIPPSIR